jgi:hypothetical protein
MLARARGKLSGFRLDNRHLVLTQKGYLDLLHRRHASPRLPHRELRALRRPQIKFGLSLRRMFRQRTRRARLLSGCSRVERISQTWGQISRRKRRVVGLYALGAQESVGPVRAVDVGAVGNGSLDEGAACDSG